MLVYLYAAAADIPAAATTAADDEQHVYQTLYVCTRDKLNIPTFH